MTQKKNPPANASITASFVSLGCFKNIVDTEVLGGMLEEKGVQIVTPYERSDWIIINTCGFIRDAKEESIDEILSALEKKEKKEIKHVALFGCLTQRYYVDLKKTFPHADIVWGVNDIQELADRIAANQPAPYRNREAFLYSHLHRRILTTTPNSTFIKISEGCDMGCSFCTIPKIRGPYRSRPMDSIVAEAEKYREMGVEELNLVSQNSSHYSMDLGNGQQLPQLLRRISALGFPWVRVLYLMPEETHQPLVDAFSLPSIVPYFDLPFQHVARNVLKSMNRKGGYAKNLGQVENIRRRIPDAVIRSSFITGFPGESEADFAELLRFVKESRIEYVGVFAYSDEEETLANQMQKKIPSPKIEERRLRLQNVADKNLERYFRRISGTLQEFMPLGPWTNRSTIGRIRSQAPEVDGFAQLKHPFDQCYTIQPVRIANFQNNILQVERDNSFLKKKNHPKKR